MPCAELIGNASEVLPRLSAAQGPPEAACCMGAQFEEFIHRQSNHVECRRIRQGFRQPELVFDAIRPPDTVPAIGGATQFEVVEMGENDDRLAGRLVRFGRHQFDGLRLKPG